VWCRVGMRERARHGAGERECKGALTRNLASLACWRQQGNRGTGVKSAGGRRASGGQEARTQFGKARSRRRERRDGKRGEGRAMPAGLPLDPRLMRYQSSVDAGYQYLALRPVRCIMHPFCPSSRCFRVYLPQAAKLQRYLYLYFRGPKQPRRQHKRPSHAVPAMRNE
jgi:hypothetical protein